MQLASVIILDMLKPFHVRSFLSRKNDFHFEHIQLLDPSIVPEDPAVLYVGCACQLSDLDPSRLAAVCIVCLGTEEELPPWRKEYQVNLLLIPPTYSLASVTNHLYTEFYRLQSWSAELEAAILSKQDYPTIFSIGGRYFGNNAMIMVNSSYNVIGTNLPAAPSHERIDQILKNGYYTKDMTDALAKMGYHTNDTLYNTPSLLYPPNYMNCPLMVLTSHANNGIFLGFITIYFIEDDPTDAQFELFSYFAQKVSQYYMESDEEDAPTPTPLEVFMADLIDHTREDETFLQDRARSLRLPVDASYRLCVIQWDKFILPTADYIRSRLRTCLKFPFFRVILYHQSILLLLQGNISSLKVIEEINESLGEFGELLKICEGYAGFSTSGFPLMKMNVAYQQAVTAARYGRMLSPETRIYFYSHYYIYEMLDDYKMRYDLEDMHIQKLKLLVNPAEDRYDNLSLLRNYLLTERSISTTAKIMHMHRNSVIYRLGKIQEILGLDLNDPDVRLRLLISFKILELQAGHIEPIPKLIDSSSGTISFFE